MELGPAGIRVNAIAPGLVRTGATAAFFDMPAIVDDFVANTTVEAVRHARRRRRRRRLPRLRRELVRQRLHLPGRRRRAHRSLPRAPRPPRPTGRAARRAARVSDTEAAAPAPRRRPARLPLLAAVAGQRRSRTWATASTPPRSRCWRPPSRANPGWSAGMAVAFTLPWLLFALPGRRHRRPARPAQGDVPGRHRAGRARRRRSPLRVVTDTASIWAALRGRLLPWASARRCSTTPPSRSCRRSCEPEQLELANGRLYAGEVVANTFVGPPIGGMLFAVAASVPFWHRQRPRS